MSGNTIGRLFQVTTFGESHGPAIGCIVDGCPPGLELSEDDFKRYEKEVQHQTDLFIKEIGDHLSHKERELLTV